MGGQRPSTTGRDPHDDGVQPDAVGGWFRERERECMSPAALCQTQLTGLRQTLHVATDEDPGYRRRLEQAGIDIDDLDCHGDAQDLPFTIPADVRERLTVGFDGRDDEARRELAARRLAAGGLSAGDVLLDVHGAGLPANDLQAAAPWLGATVVLAPDHPVGPQVDLLRLTQAAAVSAGVAGARALAEAAGSSPGGDLPLRVAFLDADGDPAATGPAVEEARTVVEAALGIAALLAYGRPELGGPVVAFECSARAGLHVNEDCFLVEVVDPDSLIALPEGELGELVVTTLCRAARPLLRYRTGDLCRLFYDPCACGRTFARMTFPEGRLTAR